ncbi:Alpha-1,3-mannosyltransferase cmt1 [Stylosanthes scabra]|uniref:Alpha-1,3-mannosyltransferase cmt1 n=1 Tax=Stylosanthes scabra TaxID=79078 RepID=A0ABU6ZRA1_9FABA|nr:Alpha-1,3-mannosyltransferase cmt1 [Stylosanthes scabra]
MLTSLVYLLYGANFRDLPGVLVKDNKVEWDPSVERVLLKSGKPLVPDYAMSFVRGTSSNHLVICGGMKLCQLLRLELSLIIRLFFTQSKIRCLQFEKTPDYKDFLIAI